MNKTHCCVCGHVDFESWYLLIMETGRRRFWDQSFRRAMETSRA